MGSLSAAAKHLGVTQPALSRQVRILESHLGVALFSRDFEGVHLTPVGAEFLRSIRPLALQIEDVFHATKHGAETVDGVIRVAALTEVGQSTLMPRILAFRQEFPGVRFHIELTSGALILEGLRKAQFDFGLVAQMASEDSLTFKEFLDERSVLVTRAQNLIDIRDLMDVKRSRFITYRNEDMLLTLFLKTHFKNVSRRVIDVILSVNSHRSMIETLLTTDAYAVMPWQSVQPALENRLLRIASSYELAGRLFLVYSQRVETIRRLKVFRDHLMMSTGRRGRVGS
jgi:DNA-binding transcriptional LysR family regulator